MNVICDVCSRNTTDTIMILELISGLRRIVRILVQSSSLIRGLFKRNRWWADCIIATSGKLLKILSATYLP